MTIEYRLTNWLIILRLGISAPAPSAVSFDFRCEVERQPASDLLVIRTSSDTAAIGDSLLSQDNSYRLAGG